MKTTPPCMRAVVEALQGLRGIALVSAVTIVAEVGELSRFPHARQLMGYSGLGAREDSSGTRTRRGGITKTGNAHLRRIAIEAACAYRHRPAVGGTLRKRQATLSEEVKVIDTSAVLGVKIFCPDVPASNLVDRPMTVEAEFVPGARSAPHIHPHQEESYEVLSGGLDVFMDGRWRCLQPGEAVRTPKGTVHAFRNSTTTGAVRHLHEVTR